MDTNNPTPAAPQGETEANPITNTNQAPEAAQTGSTAPTGASNVDLHGLDPAQLGDIAKFLESNGGFNAVKSKISNPQKTAEQPAQPQASADVQSTQPAPAEPPKPSQPPKGFASVQELAVERYFKDLARDEKYAGIADKIENGEVLKEMASMGMNPIDENYNINVNQLRQFLDLKAASVPTKPTSVEPTNIPTVDYVEVGENIADMNQALAVIQQSMEAKAKGAPAHPAEAKAREFLSSHWGKK